MGKRVVGRTGMIRWSYGHDSKCATFPWSGRRFYILRTYTYVAWKIFYGLLKSKSSPKTHTKWGAWQSLRDLNFKNLLESHFSCNKKWFVGRTVMIQSALHFPDLGECFTYPERLRTTRRKFSTGFWSQSLRQKPTQNGELGRASGTWISKIYSKVTFPAIKNDSLVVRSWFKVRYISLI